MTEMNEEKLIRAVQEGDTELFAELIPTHKGRIFATLLGILKNTEDAKDLTQEVFLKAFRRIERFEFRSSFHTWLHRIAVNSALQAVRKADTRKKREAPMPVQVAAVSSGGDALLQRKLQRALDRLPEGMRRVLILHDVEGFTHDDIGDALGVTSGTSKSQLFKARAKMRDLLSSVSGEAKETGVEAWSI
jgi:RNA polymerase sigma-70 factor (ECF subfamily)